MVTPSLESDAGNAGGMVYEEIGKREKDGLVQILHPQPARRDRTKRLAAFRAAAAKDLLCRRLVLFPGSWLELLNAFARATTTFVLAAAVTWLASDTGR